MSCAELVKHNSSVDHGLTHGMMPLDENPKYMDKVDKESKPTNDDLTCGK